MTNISRRAISYLLVVFLLLGTVFSAPIVSHAASYPTTHPNTHVNTGKGADDIVAVARTQVGYRENSVGTKYGKWYGNYFVSQPWCAMFVSWCAEQAGIPNNVIQKFASCGVGVRWFKEQGLWQDSAYYGGSYVPKKGDIIFYRNSGSSNLSDHVGIVAGVNGTYINAIEGNATNESCYEYKTSKSRSLNNAYVIGYGTPKYNGGNINVPVEGESDVHELWQITEADTLSLRKESNTSSKRLKSIPRGTILEVTEFKLESDYLWGYTKYSGKAGWCALDYCTYISGNIGGEYYQHPPRFYSDTVEIYVQQRIQLYAENALGAKYKSSDKNIAVTSKTGKVRGIAKGTVTVKCITNTGVAKCTVNVINPKLEKKKLTTCVLDTCQLKVIGAQEEITFESKDESIATVDKEGVVTGVSAGKVVITATVSGVALKCTVTIEKEPDTLERFKVRSKKAYLRDAYQGKSIVLIPKGTLLKVTEVKYSDTYSWGKTQYDGKDGWVVLNSCDYFDGHFNGTVYKMKPYLKDTSKSMCVGTTHTIEVTDYEGKLKFKSKKPEIADVDKNGVVTAVSEGTTNIVIKNGDTTLKFKITVKNPKLNKEKLDLLPTEKVQLKVKDCTEIKWKSSDKKVAKVNSKGVVTAVGYGTATIIATAYGVDVECQVNVYDAVLEAEKITLKTGERAKIKVTQNLSTDIKWKSSNKKIVAVSRKGTIRAVGKGKAKVTAMVDGKTLTCNVKVKK